MNAQLRVDRLGDYHFVRELAPGRSTLLENAVGHRIVIKPLPDDCLLGGQLHPNIRQRLARLRELASLRLATLRGVERLGTRAYLVWEYVEGQSLSHHACDLSPALMREVALAIEALHAHGLTHGAIHVGNVIVSSTPDRAIRLTHASPLLYEDPGDDVIATINLFETLLRDGGRNHSLRELLSRAKGQRQPLPWLRAHLRFNALGGLADEHEDTSDNSSAHRHNLRVAAGAVLLAAAVFSAAVAWWSLRRETASTPQPLRAGSLVSPAPSPP